MIRALIVDDEALARRGIQARLREAEGIEVVGLCENGREAIAALRAAPPDLVFLDVQMPGLDGFGVIEAVGPAHMPMVIFVTAYDAHALHAFEVHAVDYLLKPIDDERFAKALDRVRARFREKQESALGRQVSALMESMKPVPDGAQEPTHDHKNDNRFVIKSGGRVVFVECEEVDWVEAAGDYVRIHAGRSVHLLRETMTAMEKRLDPATFIRVHRSTIINARRIRELRHRMNGDYVVSLEDGTQLNASRRYRDRLEAFFGSSL